MTKLLELSLTQIEGYEVYSSERAYLDAREKRFLNNCLVERGGNLNEPWVFDRNRLAFVMEVPDETAAPTAGD